MNRQSQDVMDVLPVFYRTAGMPMDVWKAIKNNCQQKHININNMIHAAIDAEFACLIEKLKELGLTETNCQRKLVRIPFDENILAWINYGKRETGLPSILLLKLCLYQFTKNQKAVVK